MSWLAKWRKKTLSNRIRERSPGSETRGAERCGMRCRAPAPGPAAPPEKRSQSYAPSQAVNMNTNVDSEKAFLLEYPERCLSGDGICEGHLTQESKVLNKIMRILPWRQSPRTRANMKQRIRATAIGSTFSGVGTQVWKTSGR